MSCKVISGPLRGPRLALEAKAPELQMWLVERRGEESRGSFPALKRKRKKKKIHQIKLVPPAPAAATL